MTIYPTHLLPYSQNLLYQRAGIQYPVVVFRPQTQQLHHPDSVLSSKPPTHIVKKDSFTFYDSTHLGALLVEKPTLYDGATYIMQQIATNPLTIHGGIGRYYDMLATCDALEQEIYHTNGKFPLRDTLHAIISPEAALTDGQGRSAAIGVSTLIVFNLEGDYRAILARRSSQTAIHAGMYHVLPAFMLEPTETDVFAASSWNLTRQVEREILEEVFGVPENDDYDNHPALEDLRMMRTTGRASLYLTGVVMNLLTMRPEIGTLLLIHDRDWYPRITAPDSPFPLRTAAETDGHTLVYPPIADDSAFFSHLPDDILSRMPAQAGAAMWLAIDLARDLLKRREK